MFMNKAIQGWVKRFSAKAQEAAFAANSPFTIIQILLIEMVTIRKLISLDIIQYWQKRFYPLCNCQSPSARQFIFIFRFSLFIRTIDSKLNNVPVINDEQENMMLPNF